MHIADMLSRAYILDQNPIPSGDYQIFQVLQENRLFKEIEDIDPAKHVRLSEKGLTELREATRNDNTLKDLAKVIHRGWPELKQDIQPSIRTYWPYRDELIADNNIIFKGSKVVIPESMRSLMLQRTHASHQGPDASVRRARDVIFWLGMASEIRHQTSQCATCNSLAAKQQKQPLMSPEIPTTPWAKVAQNLFTYDGKPYLITVDYYSDFWELDAVSDTTSETIVKHTKAHFARYGIPETVITDNGPQFRAQQLKILPKSGE